LPGASQPRSFLRRNEAQFEAFALLKQRDELPHSCHLQLLSQPDNGGTMPGKRAIFTPLSILFRPHHKMISSAISKGEIPSSYGGGAGYRPRVQ